MRACPRRSLGLPSSIGVGRTIRRRGIDISIASQKLSDVANQNQEMLAFVVGVICGISEKILSGTITTKTKALIGSVK